MPAQRGRDHHAGESAIVGDKQADAPIASAQASAQTSGQASAQAIATPTLGEAVLVWAKIGCLGFGGPAGQIALMHRMMVEEKRWIGEDRFLHALSFCMLLPGPEAQQLATYIGWLMRGLTGALLAGILFILPGAAVMLALVLSYHLYGDTPALEAAFFGVRAAVIAIVFDAVRRVAERALSRAAHLAIAAAAFLALFVFELPFPLVVAAAGAIGLVVPVLATGTGSAGDEPALGSDHQTRFLGLGRALKVGLVSLGLWFAPVVLVMVALGGDGVFADIGVFFSKMAVVTFGGAYAVLAYVAQQAVEVYGWMNPGEMLDGLGLAETTPGPLILVVEFVGYLAAARAEPVAGAGPVVMGIAGAMLTLWVTFTPSFLWILLGAPYMERLRGNRALSGALTAITAAVVGVMANLALWLALHVLFSTVGELRFGPIRLFAPELASLDSAALVLAAAALVAVIWFRAGAVAVLAGATAAGLIVKIAI